jgi:hypothetical protein
VHHHQLSGGDDVQGKIRRRKDHVNGIFDAAIENAATKRLERTQTRARAAKNSRTEEGEVHRHGIRGEREAS